MPADKSAAPITPQITVLDTGGQYAHLIARRVRDLGAYADVQPSDIPAAQLSGRRGVIISGGPASVYEPGSPQIDRAILSGKMPVLGICYGHQLLAHYLGGRVAKGDKGEYGLAHLTVTQSDPLWDGVAQTQIWMSHRDTVDAAPPGFRITAETDVSGVAAMSDPQRRLYGLQFHPEVVHTSAGSRILENFVFDVCQARRDWNVAARVPLIEEQIRQRVENRKVFFFVSGGVDSTVAYTLCLRALGPERVAAVYVDTGLMREGETDFVRAMFKQIGARHLLVDDAADEFLSVLDGLQDPEKKRLAIGEQFVRVQQRILATEHFLDHEWILGQGTIYPDTIESAGTARADLIKTHHNRVAGIQDLIDQGRILEPLTTFYKDEVREIGREIGITPDFLSRHPFPGPGLAIRCLCSASEQTAKSSEQGVVLPVRSVGVQGDSRSYCAVLAIPAAPSTDILQRAPGIVNSMADINRVVSLSDSLAPLEEMSTSVATVDAGRLSKLRRADEIVRSATLRSGFDDLIWQMPVVLLPFGTHAAPDSVVLRPVQSADGMTANVVLMPPAELKELTADLLRVPGIAAVFYDMTHKPPGTIEWE